MRDSNDLQHPSENIGITPHPQWLLREFTKTVQVSGLRNFDFEGFQFTWEKGRWTPNKVRGKLDRILVNNLRLQHFSEARVTSFEAPSRNYLPLALWPLLTVRADTKRCFKFENN
ncbi:uncharacterized protein LOC116023401 [Ipomoea triloba]|uniref:uncharacterized protein LOC116023401 n=1 Tax=Ipomoea triloba TaxID=35885 RepID=UPI00125D4EDB|nr:uncharacterized protein LOC116023401 [Ipomoea triloba]